MTPIFQRIGCPAVLCAALFASIPLAKAADVSPPPILQWFESSYDTQERRTADLFMAGYGAVWLPPPGRADMSDFSVGYDVYDRFDLGRPGKPTLYGTETGLKTVADALHRAGIDLQIDYIINHNGFSDSGTPGFAESGGYPGMFLEFFGDPDGDFNSAFAWGDVRGRLAGLIDIDHAKDYRAVRNPVPGVANNIGPGTIPDAAGRLANVPDENNRRFYPDRNLDPIWVYDPFTGEGDIPIYPFNTDDPMAGNPTEENATGYLMRYAQWMVQEVGVDGFRIDAAKHIEGFALDYFDRAVYRQNPRTLLDGSTRQVFSYSEVFDGNRDYLQTFVKKTIDPGQPGVIGGNRDVLDFPLYFALRDNLTGNGYANDWYNVRNAAMDFQDDALHNGSQGVMFVNSHDDFGPYLSNVAQAYVLMHPGNATVYFNGKEFGDNRDFPKDGRGDALGGVYGDTITRLVDIRNTHGRGNYRERWIEKELFAYEREGSALVLLNNRTDDGFDSRTLQVSFPWGTKLIELTGNAKNNPDVPEMIEVFDDYYQGPTKVNVRFPRNGGGDNGYLIYGLATPQSPAGIELSGVDSVLPGGDPGANGYENGTTRLADLYVVKGDSFQVQLNTAAVNLLDLYRDRDADGDNALLKIDGGLDVNGNGRVDFVSPGSVTYGFEEFRTAKSPGYDSGDGNGYYAQNVDAAGLAEGTHFLTVRAFRHRDDGGPAVFSDFKKAIYVDRLPPESAVESFEPFDPNFQQNRDLIVRSLDKTADSVHLFLNLPAELSDADVLQMAAQGQGRSGKIDRDLFAYGMFDVPHGNNVATIVTFEINGTSSVRRVPGLFASTVVGRGLGDVNLDGVFSPDDLENRPDAFEAVLYSRNAQFNPAADVNGDGRVDNRDLFGLRAVLSAGGASQETHDALEAVLARRGDVNRNGTTGADDLDAIFLNLGSTDWALDLDTSGAADANDVDTLLREILGTNPGDANLDGLVDQADLVPMAAHWKRPLTSLWDSGDFTGNGTVDEDDLAIVLANWQGQDPLDVDAFLASVPEPSSAALALFGLLALVALSREKTP